MCCVSVSVDCTSLLTDGAAARHRVFVCASGFVEREYCTLLVHTFCRCYPRRRQLLETDYGAYGYGFD